MNNDLLNRMKEETCLSLGIKDDKDVDMLIRLERSEEYLRSGLEKNIKRKYKELFVEEAPYSAGEQAERDNALHRVIDASIESIRQRDFMEEWESSTFADALQTGEAMSGIEWWIKDLCIGAGTLSGVIGPAKSGKSLFVYGMAIALASHAPEYAGRPITTDRPLEIGLFSADMNNPKIINNLINRFLFNKSEEEKREIGKHIHFPRIKSTSSKRMLYSDASLERFKKLIEKWDVIILDSLSTYHSEDENSTAVRTMMLDPLRKIMEEQQKCCVVIHHSGKGKGSVSRGSSAIVAALDCAMVLRTKNGHKQLVSYEVASEDENAQGDRHNVNEAWGGRLDLNYIIDDSKIVISERNVENDVEQNESSSQEDAKQWIRQYISRCGINPTKKEFLANKTLESGIEHFAKRREIKLALIREQLIIEKDGRVYVQE